jgi:nucleoside phosphorylase
VLFSARSSRFYWFFVYVYLSKEMISRFNERCTPEVAEFPKDAPIEIEKRCEKAPSIDPTYGIITALPEEHAAIASMLSNVRKIMHNNRLYDVGEVVSSTGSTHSVVLSLVGVGTTIAAAKAALLLEDFSSVKYLITVGVAGGVPNVHKPSEHVRLGDVVVSNEKGIIQYDFVKKESSKETLRPPPRPSSPRLLQAVKLLESAELRGERPWIKFLEKGLQRLNVTLPPNETDILLSSDDSSQTLTHLKDPQRRKGEPRIFVGPIASSNILLKDPKKRDELGKDYNVKAIEMEAAGVADAAMEKQVGLLVIRGICDYCDSDKNDVWHVYSALTAAAYTTALLESIPKVA